MVTRESGLRSLEGSVDPRAWGCRGVMPRSGQFLSTTVYPFKDKGGEECSVFFYPSLPHLQRQKSISLAFLSRQIGDTKWLHTKS